MSRMSRPLDPLNYAHAESRNRNIRIESIAQFTQTLYTMHATNQRTCAKYSAAGQGWTTRYAERILEFTMHPGKASRFVDQEAAYRSFLYLRVFLFYCYSSFFLPGSFSSDKRIAGEMWDVRYAARSGWRTQLPCLISWSR
jgi:hypothetical protein